MKELFYLGATQLPGSFADKGTSKREEKTKFGKGKTHPSGSSPILQLHLLN